jgi:DNA invertase Pin-like site-specific DNA recombinase
MDQMDLTAAAQYLRMSTEHQQYSLENQAAAIRSYAERKGFEIVKSYSDAAKSGVLFRKRPGLSQLIQDVINGKAPFKAVLVYDVSRWGRFQDSDEAAHYEFICKQARIPVHYCAETFTNDGSTPSSVMKALKRAMAAEYSRELGLKVFASEKRWAELGFKQGGSAGYALRRLMISSDGTRKQLLADGEVKCLQSDRVILVPGPPEEVECVREMYRLVVEEGRTPFSVTRELNRKGLTCRGRQWSYTTVCRILAHPKYAGYNVWNQTSRRLAGPELKVPRSKWVIKSNAFEALVDPNIFNEAQRVLAQRTCSKSNDQVLESLRQLLAEKGTLTSRILKMSGRGPSQSVCVKRFGSLRHAFELAGFRYPYSTLATMDRRKKTREIREKLVAQISSLFPDHVTIVHFRSKCGIRVLLKVDKLLMVSVSICRTVGTNGDRWEVGDKHGHHENLVLLGRLRPGTDDLQDLYIVPPLAAKCCIRADDEILSRGKQLFDLSGFCSAVRAVAAGSGTGDSEPPTMPM